VVCESLTYPKVACLGGIAKMGLMSEVRVNPTAVLRNLREATIVDPGLGGSSAKENISQRNLGDWTLGLYCEHNLFLRAVWEVGRVAGDVDA